MASYVFGISLVFGMMEDVGYMARISYVFDDTMTKLGYRAKQFMPFLVSFGCNIGGITGTRVIDSWGQRVMTIAVLGSPLRFYLGRSWTCQRYVLRKRGCCRSSGVVCRGVFAHLYHL